MVQVIVIGSGIAGLAAAIRLARQGIEVAVYEASGKPGGKVSQLQFNGFRFDTGPSLLTLPSLILELLDEDLQFHIKKLDIITRYFYEDGTILSAFSDADKMIEEISTKLPVQKNTIKSYLEKASDIYNLTSDLFIFGTFHHIKSLVNLKSLNTVMNFRKLHAFATLHDFNQKQLSEAHLVQLFDRYATYNGSNPYQAPATLSVISHLEHNTGAFIPQAGMYTIVHSLQQQAERLGVIFHFNANVEKVECHKGKVNGIWINGELIPSDMVVSDIDIHRFYSVLMPDKKRLANIQKQERSTSALIFYWGIKGNFPEMDIHNIFFSAHYKDEFDHLFEKGEVYSDPTVYIYISSKYQKSDAPDGHENWFVMINAPADKGQPWTQIIKQARKDILAKMERILDKSIKDKIVCEQVLSPPDIERLTGSVNGSIYGSSSNSRFSSFNRHANFRSDMKGLFFVGGSVHPGGGIPLCLSSARIVAGLVKEQLRKTKQ
ncbi:MAG: 1-hydroxycarotenoid 3,4-desaturase CrtD [Bacteroidales bacterium]